MATIFWSWFYRFSQREQYVLLSVTVMVLLVFIYQFWLLPLHQGAVEERLRTQKVADALLRVESLGREISLARTHKSQGKRVQAPSLAELVDRTLRQHQLVMRGFQPGKDGEAQVILEKVAYAQLMAWLYELEQKQSVQITQLSLSAAQPAQLVNANVGLLVSH